MNNHAEKSLFQGLGTAKTAQRFALGGRAKRAVGRRAERAVTAARKRRRNNTKNKAREAQKNVVTKQAKPYETRDLSEALKYSNSPPKW
jgi:hypothetical protein